MNPFRKWLPSGSLKGGAWLGMVLAVALLGWNLIGGGGVMASSGEGSRILTVTGQGSTQVETSIAQIRLGVILRGNSAQTVQQQVAESSERLVTRLKELQVNALQTTGISLYPQYDYRDGQSRLTGVQGQNSVQFEVPVASAGQVLDEAVAAGATQVESVNFRADDAALVEARSRALAQAVEDAQRQAQDVLGALNLTLGSVERIQIHSDGRISPPPIPLAASADFARSEIASTPVEGGEQNVRAQVTLEIRY
ncbi:SIMPL domain-containing protein [Synechococcus sp. Nb3U1]|uniref:SIMPL domain-containing protein n=1 Tax=Synechococcus sp. Nb3U1 TaxID=1914529 RepID=UPI001F3D9DA9|nr:SIMPL domain-containing protein [Synechococcus sp. Nb3U1]MCF2972705.1 SIMPL domain-containing protein [Synechococcus sp. Nb3U1]